MATSFAEALKAVQEYTPEFLNSEPKEEYGFYGLQIRNIGIACPEQYEIYYQNRKVGYVRLRHGLLRANYPDHNGETIYTKNLSCDGSFDSQEQRESHLRDISLMIKLRIKEKRNK